MGQVQTGILQVIEPGEQIPFEYAMTEFKDPQLGILDGQGGDPTFVRISAPQIFRRVSTLGIPCPWRITKIGAVRRF
jgi:hypothetical protein